MVCASSRASRRRRKSYSVARASAAVSNVPPTRNIHGNLPPSEPPSSPRGLAISVSVVFPKGIASRATNPRSGSCAAARSVVGKVRRSHWTEIGREVEVGECRVRLHCAVSQKCGREDLNLHPRRDQDLNLARMPISPRPQRLCLPERVLRPSHYLSGAVDA